MDWVSFAIGWTAGVFFWNAIIIICWVKFPKSRPWYNEFDELEEQMNVKDDAGAQSRAGEAGANLTAGLAAQIARAIFSCGDELGDKTQRIQFIGGTWPDNEKSMGGLCEDALVDLIARTLAANVFKEPPKPRRKTKEQLAIDRLAVWCEDVFSKGYHPEFKNGLASAWRVINDGLCSAGEWHE